MSESPEPLPRAIISDRRVHEFVINALSMPKDFRHASLRDSIAEHCDTWDLYGDDRRAVELKCITLFSACYEFFDFPDQSGT